MNVTKCIACVPAFLQCTYSEITAAVVNFFKVSFFVGTTFRLEFTAAWSNFKFILLGLYFHTINRWIFSEKVRR